MRLREAIRGTWWLPGGEPVAGELAQDTSGELRIRLWVPVSRSALPTCCEVIGGTAHSGKSISVFESTLRESRVYPSGAAVEYGVGTAIVGDRISDAVELRYSAACISFPSLPYWLGPPLLSRPVDPHDRGPIEASRLPPIQFEDGIIEPVRYVETHYDLTRRLVLEERAQLEVRFEVSLLLDELRERVTYPLERFLSLAAGRWETGVALRVAEGVPQQERLGGQETSTYLDVYESRSTLSGLPAHHRHDFLFAYEDVVKCGPDAFRIWLTFSGALKDAVANWMRSEFSGGATLPERLRSAVSCLDALNKERHDNPAHDRTWLRTILREHLSEAGSAIGEMIVNEESFIKTVVDSRNYWTHFGRDPNSRADREIDLAPYEKVLSLLVRARLLQHLGFSQSAVTSLFNQSSVTKWIRDHVRVP